MAAGIFTANTTLKVAGAVSATGNSTGSPTTLYTAGSTAYGIVQVNCTAYVAPCSLTIGGRAVYTWSAAGPIPYALYVGPSQAVAFTGGNISTAVICGVEISNSP